MWVRRSGYLIILIWSVLFALILRIYYISFSDLKTRVEMTAGSRSATFTLYNSKGVIYDRNLIPLAGNQFVYYIIVDPRRFDTSKLDYICEISSSDNKTVSDKLKKETPFVLNSYVMPDEIEGVYVYEGTGRYPEDRGGQHIIGYLDSDGKIGLSGLEKAYDDVLSAYSNNNTFSYSANAVRGINPQSEIIFNTFDDSVNGLVTSLDKTLSDFAEQAMEKYIDRGCVVVMDCDNGEILVLSSSPTFDVNNMSEYSSSSNGELINNALVNQTVGSVFKLVIAACALENNAGEFTYKCGGATAVSKRTFTCQNKAKHGEQTLEEALANSCNCYFISLGQLLGYEKIIETAQSMGLDSSLRIAKDLYTEAGTFPKSEGSLSMANLSIGQGELMLTPVSVARMTAAICNGGYLVNPSLYIGRYVDDAIVNEPEYSYKNKVLSDDTANAIKEMCVSCVESGTGKNAKPEYGGAGGKTASAQTGKFNEDGEEVLNTYFTGFYPAKNPEYVITVFAADGDSGSATCAPVFGEICDFIGQNY